MNPLYDVAVSFATENQKLAEDVYHYLRAEGLSVFYAPSPECQRILSAENQRESFYRIFGLESRYVVLLVSEFYIRRQVPMEEARIAFSKHREDASVIPVYLDEAKLPQELLNPEKTNYFVSHDAAEIAAHVAFKIRKSSGKAEAEAEEETMKSFGTMKNDGNTANTQIFIQNYK